MISFSKSLTDGRSPWLLTQIRLSFPPSHPSLPPPPSRPLFHLFLPGWSLCSPGLLHGHALQLPGTQAQEVPVLVSVSNPVVSRCSDVLLWGRFLISRSVLGLFPSAVHPLITSWEEGHMRVNVGRPVCYHVSHLYGVGLGKTAPAGTVRPQMLDVTAALPRALLPSRVAVERSSATCLLTLLYDFSPLLEALPCSSLWRLLWDFTTLCFGVVLFSLSVLGTRWAALNQDFSELFLYYFMDKCSDFSFFFQLILFFVCLFLLLSVVSST